MPLVISSAATCPTPAEAFAQRSQHGAMCICKGRSHSLPLPPARPDPYGFRSKQSGALNELKSRAPSCTPACRAQKLPKVRTVVLLVLEIVMSSSRRVPAPMEATAPRSCRKRTRGMAKVLWVCAQPRAMIACSMPPSRRFARHLARSVLDMQRKACTNAASTRHSLQYTQRTT